MAYSEKHTIAVTTSTAGAFTGYTDALINKPVHTVIWTSPTGATAFASGSTVTISTRVTAQIILANAASLSFIKVPAQNTHTATGGVVNFSTGSDAVARFVPASEQIKCVVANGGSVKSGTLTVICV